MVNEEEKLKLIINIASVEIWKYEDYCPNCLGAVRMIMDVYGRLWIEIKGEKPENTEIKYAKIQRNGVWRPFEKYVHHQQANPYPTPNMNNIHTHKGNFDKYPVARELIVDNISWIRNKMIDRERAKVYILNFGGRKRVGYQLCIRFYNKKSEEVWYDGE
ncbi:MAG: hypothetical protein BZ138_07975 [Methanosphaera sp. rholeuAM270]|nr:MAG: hypothetical protein BZ138_07975 [Methanosphaera sp. rholeuAM270]